MDYGELNTGTPVPESLTGRRVKPNLCQTSTGQIWRISCRLLSVDMRPAIHNLLQFGSWKEKRDNHEYSQLHSGWMRAISLISCLYDGSCNSAQGHSLVGFVSSFCHSLLCLLMVELWLHEVNGHNFFCSLRYMCSSRLAKQVWQHADDFK